MKKVLVTGATGFIGNYVVEELLHQNFKVIATSSAPDKASRMPWYDQVKYIAFDLRNFKDTNNYFELFDQPDMLLHLAWEGLPNYKNDFHLTENFPRHLSFLNNLFQNGLKDLTVSGTCFEYGMKEGRLSEEMESKPANAYAIAKDKLRKNLQVISEQKGVALKWVRLFYMYGKDQHPNSLIPQLDRAFAEGQEVFNMSGGEQERDFLAVQMVASYLVKIAIQNKTTGIINCCSGKPIKVKDFVVSYVKEKDKQINLNLGYYPYADYEPMRFWGDTTKLRSILEEE